MTQPATPTNAATWARALYREAVDRKDAAGFAAVFIEKGTLRFGNQPLIVGRENIEKAITQFFLAMAELRHEFTAISREENTWFLEALVTYTRHDGGVVTVPAMTVFAMEETGERPMARECCIYVDLAPLFAPSEENKGR